MLVFQIYLYYIIIGIFFLLTFHLIHLHKCVMCVGGKNLQTNTDARYVSAVGCHHPPNDVFSPK